MTVATIPIDFSAMLEAIPNPLLIVNADNQVQFANIAAENFFKASSKSLSRRGLDTIIPQTSPVLSLLDEVRRSKATINEYGVTIGTPRSGGERVTDLQLAPVIDQKGTVLLQILQRSMAQKIDRQLTHRNAARAVTGMAAMLAHEIKNPLSGIRGAAQLLEPGLDGNDLELTELIVTETDRIRDLVNQMEEFSDERPIETSAVNIHSVLSHVKKVAQSGFANKISIKEIYDPSLPSVLGNRDQLIQVLLNLVKNAAEAIEDAMEDAMEDANEEGEISLSTSFRPGVHLSVRGSGERISLPLEVKVTNTGAKIAPDILPHLFEPFVSSKPNGKGLGLALTAKIIGDHSGVIECESNDYQTVFTILLPMVEHESGEDEY